MSVSVIAGLGNPGSVYRHTRHNIGRAVVEALAERLGATFKDESQWKARVARCKIAEHPLLLVIPETYMNDSGSSLRSVCRYFKIPVEKLVVVYDELQLELGSVKISVGGGSGGHNGLEDILAQMEEGFIRYRIGIGPKIPPEMDLKDFVLGKFTNYQQSFVSKKMPEFVGGLKLLVDRGPLLAMNQLNQREKINDRDADES